MRGFYTSWRTRLGEVDFGTLSQEAKVDYVLLDNRLKYQLALLDRQDKERNETASLVPFATPILALQDARRDLVDVERVATARTLSALTKQVDSLRAPRRRVRWTGRRPRAGARGIRQRAVHNSSIRVAHGRQPRRR